MYLIRLAIYLLATTIRDLTNTILVQGVGKGAKEENIVKKERKERRKNSKDRKV